MSIPLTTHRSANQTNRDQHNFLLNDADHDGRIASYQGLFQFLQSACSRCNELTISGEMRDRELRKSISSELSKIEQNIGHLRLEISKSNSQLDQLDKKIDALAKVMLTSRPNSAEDRTLLQTQLSDAFLWLF